MQSIQTSHVVPLTSVKPLEDLLEYRKVCLEATKKALAAGKETRTESPIDGSRLLPWNFIDG
ncbi:MAG: hypothetical protein Q8P84_01420, partial [Deltaproteobacteria bacterium]|nr:hypothetical protein [Deltaproteobacteria bacterium]